MLCRVGCWAVRSGWVNYGADGDLNLHTHGNLYWCDDVKDNEMEEGPYQSKTIPLQAWTGI
jgi:hypothetical protein